MASSGQYLTWIVRTSRRAVTAALALPIVFMLALGPTQSVQAQTYKVLHNFTGEQDGAIPVGLTIDRGGNLYGTASGGGAGYGAIFKLAQKGSGWVLTPLYIFQAGPDGVYPGYPVLIGSDGSLYGTTEEGGGLGNCYYDGCGTVFKLRPAARASGSALAPWTEAVLYRFTGADGAFATSGLVSDSAGNLYGTTLGGGIGDGNVYLLSPSNGGWTESLVYSFTGGDDGSGPLGGLTFDGAGNLYGTTDSGGLYGEGTVYELTPSGSGWAKRTLYSFTDGYSVAGLILDQSGNAYGTTQYGGCCFSGTVFELKPSNGQWTFTVLHNFAGQYSGPEASLTMDAAGNLYGTTYAIGAHEYGNVFKLSPLNGGWIYTSLYDFTGGTDGGYPRGNLVLDANGNLYGTVTYGGTGGPACSPYCGVVFEITP